MNTRAMLDELVMRGADDWVQACEVAEVAKFMGTASTVDAIRELSARLIRELLERGLMVVGDVTKTGFRSWNVPLNEAIQRIEREWRALPKGPTLGEVCWLSLTEKGKSRAEALSRGTER